MNLNKKQKLLALLTSSMVFLAGCMKYDANNQPTGFIYEWLVVPTQQILNTVASFFGGNYVISIVIVSFIIRLLMMPSAFKQSRTMLVQQEKMAMLKPYMDEINARANAATSPEEKMAIQQESMELYRLNDVSPLGGLSGCLPLLIQIPIFNALWNAIRLSPEISSSTFMGISLGSSFMPIAIATAAVYLVQSFMSQSVMDPEQKKQMQSMLYVTPVMMLMMTWSTPAGVGIYFLAGGLIMLLQTWIQNSFIRPKVKAEIDQQLKNKQVVLPKKTKTSPSKATPASQAMESYNARMNKSGKNAGKQNRR